MISQYLKERAKWRKFGKPYRSQEEMNELFSICSSCENFNKTSEEAGSCQICGCHIKKTGSFLNKIAWATTHCPLEEPKWEESDDKYKANVKLTPKELNQAEQEHKSDLEKEKTANRPKSRGGCGCNGRR